MKQRLFIFLSLVLFLLFPSPALAQATDAATPTTTATPTAGVTTPTFLLFILGGSLFLAGLLIQRRISYKPSQ
ncbi:hypothetical protein KKI19_01430 [Patescibacteria group bacterium]|nr:hypothetical protein [Patescibacteria group bacterium]